MLNNRYEIIKPIKSGGFAEVYLAKDHNLGINVALKRYHLEQMASKVGGIKNAEKYSVINEIRRAISFNHPNVARYYDAFRYEMASTFGKEHYEIGVVEYLADGDLSDFIKRNGIGSEKVKNALIGILKGLEYLHSKQIIHRDIKENNILFDGDIPKIIDFGISKEVESNGSGSTSLLFSTPGYLAPEQIEPNKYSVNGKVTHNIDFWAFGVMLYYQFKKELPFGTYGESEESKSAFRMRVLTKDIEELDWTGIPSNFIQVIKRCLKKNACERVNKAQDLIDLLDHKAYPIPPKPITKPDPKPVTIIDPPPPLPQPSSTSKWIYYLLGGIVFAIVIGVLISKNNKYPVQNQSDKTTQTDQPTKIAENQDTSPSFPVKNENSKTIEPAIPKKDESRREFPIPVIPEKDESRRESPEVTLQKRIISEIRSNMVKVDGGSFIMGCTDEQGQDCASDEYPAHEEEVGTFYISNIEVTQQQYKAIMGNNPSYFKNCDRCPVETVSWYDANEFIKRLNKLSGESYRLPSSVEWEYAARGGKKSNSYKYSGSNDINKVAWYDVNSGNKTHEVGGKYSNELGIYDMSGNEWEWCSDHYSKDYNSSRNSTSLEIRGGSWNGNPRDCRVADRYNFDPSDRSSGIGFRLCRT